jgi:methylase of polypeptide subunit release factors
MSIARHHAEWISLLDVSGPFLTMPVLLRAFPQGLGSHKADQYKELRTTYDEWFESKTSPAIHHAWMRYVLTVILELPDEVLAQEQGVQNFYAAFPEWGETLRPDLAVIDPDTRQPRMLVNFYPPTQSLEKSIAGRHWQAAPATRMMELLHGVGCPLGLVSNGEEWMLVHAKSGETTSYIRWYAHLWLEELITFRAFQNLLDVHRFFSVDESNTLAALFDESIKNQQEVTEQLGMQVRRAVEMLVQTLDRADRDSHRTLLEGISETELYNAALTVMMRLVFLFCAEERKLFPLDDELYSRNYAVSTMQEQLREAADKHGEEILERRRDAWCRLLATFRAVHGGIHHDRLNLPAYGGDLFDPDHYPFLEGRTPGTSWQDDQAKPLPVDNRTVLHLLESLQILRVKVPGGGPAESRRLSFRALDIEQIGHVYEGLLDHTAKRATEVVVSLKAKEGDEPEIALSELERLVRTNNHSSLIKFLKQITGRSENALKKDLLAEPDMFRMDRLRSVCENDEELLRQALPFAELVRDDSFGYPVVIPAGSVYVTQGSDRRSTGTHYTPRSLTEPIVQYTLEPILYPDLAEGKSKEESRRLTFKEIFDLKICDMAMGSGAFLVQTCRYLADAVTQLWAEAEEKARQNGEELTLTVPYADPVTGQVSERILPADEEERKVMARRLTAEKCLYGVDKNPMAVEMAKLSLWLITMYKDRPFTFLDHALKCGDSLLGAHHAMQIDHVHINPDIKIVGWDEATNPTATGGSSDALGGYRYRSTHPTNSSNCVGWDEATNPTDGISEQNGGYRYRSTHPTDVQGFFWFQSETAKKAMRQALEKRMQLESYTVNDIHDQHRKAELLKEADQAVDFVRLIGDLIVGAAIATADGNAEKRSGKPHKDFDELRNIILDHVHSVLTHGKGEEFERDMRVLKTLAQEYLHQKAERVSSSRHPFHWPVEFPEVFQRKNGGFDAIVGNPPFMGGQKITGELGTDYRNYLIDHLANGKKGSADICSYFFLRANMILRHPGGFGLLATNTIAQGDTREVGLGQLTENGCAIPRAIPSRKWSGEANLEVAHVWLRKGKWKNQYLLDEKPQSGITSFLTKPGKAIGNPYRLAANADQSFQGSIVLGMGFVMTPEEAQGLIERNPKNKDVLFPYLNGEDLNSRPDQSPSRWVINFFDWPLNRETAPEDYNGPVAADYPDCLAIVEEKVKPQRENDNRKIYREKWWHYAEKRPALYSTIAGMERVLVRAQVSKTWAWYFFPNKCVYDAKLIVFAFESVYEFSLLQSTHHWEWSINYGTTLRLDMSYTPTTNFETFPFPKMMENLEGIGKIYYEHRQQIMLTRQEGLTKTYNRFHNTHEKAEDIRKLRELHVEMDYAVAKAYGWEDLALGHGFHETKQGQRYTICEDARMEVLDRLLLLNHERHEEEMRQGLHDKKKGKKGAGKGKKKNHSMELFENL